MKKLLNGILAKIFNGNAKKTHNKEYGSSIPKPDDKQMQEQFPVPETPFMIIKMENTFFVTFREYRLTDPMSTIFEAWDKAIHPDWQVHINLMNAIILTHDQMKAEIRDTEIKNNSKKFMSNLTKK